MNGRFFLRLLINLCANLLSNPVFNIYKFFSLMGRTPCDIKRHRLSFMHKLTCAAFKVFSAPHPRLLHSPLTVLYLYCASQAGSPAAEQISSTSVPGRVCPPAA